MKSILGFSAPTANPDQTRPKFFVKAREAGLLQKI
jgi:hypothetical protein